MGKWGVAAAVTGVGGTGAAGTYAAHSMGVFGGGAAKPKQIGQLAGDLQGDKAPYANKCLKDIFQDETISDGLPLLDTTFTRHHLYLKEWKCGDQCLFDLQLEKRK